MINDIIADAKQRMNGAIEALRSDLQSIRTGRASPALVDRLDVDYYGTPTPLQQIASITAADAQMLLIQPYSPTDISAIEKAIMTSELGLNPSNDGQQIRLVIPPLTEERRKEFAKQIGSRAEDARIAIRNVRRDAINDLRDFEKEGEISEDDLHRGQDRVQETTDDFIKQVEEVAKAKEEEVMQI